MAHRSEVLDDIMQGTDFLARTIFQWMCFNNVTYMCTMDLT